MQKWIRCKVSGVLLYLISSSAHAEVIAANNFSAEQKLMDVREEIGMNYPAYNNYTNSAWGQSFIANVGGHLTKLETLLAVGRGKKIPTTPPLVVSFCESTNGIPTSTLGAISFSPEDFNTLSVNLNYREAIDFSNFRIPIRAGSEYIVTYQSPFSLPATSTSDAPYHIGIPLVGRVLFGRDVTLARNGVNWELATGRELALTVWVMTPEPTSLHLLLAFTIVFFPSRRSIHDNVVQVLPSSACLPVALSE